MGCLGTRAIEDSGPKSSALHTSLRMWSTTNDLIPCFELFPSAQRLLKRYQLEESTS
ncbi:hypothetical protein PGT21_029306 [Puccinia graminis f. sp. tritici]|uniref:Uncharacterized protein n=1 Tax=Puccinia graminis f. sp. tritici TaxID=56615 RepID=A0A5B0NPN6_PUCGR|nr:hypothetical protein PGTUg99_025933 [Puccinia graminis f. sp. tritici]KAA1091237.1 hypothetical protein PGT21_029306 [Puccinia graminis f. sp. tritici]